MVDRSHGRGVVRPDGGESDLFVLELLVAGRELTVGDRVEFSVGAPVDALHGPIATNVHALDADGGTVESFGPPAANGVRRFPLSNGRSSMLSMRRRAELQH